MFAIPISTDAPLYHAPRGTGGILALNVLIGVALLTGLLGPPAEVLDRWGLSHDGWHPLQWVTSHLLHASYAHLFFNMFFLWGFGLVIEGKVGTPGFLLIYFGLGATESLLEQACMHGGTSCGASAIIFGLLVMALIWAPMNEFSVAYLLPFPFQMGTFDLSIYTFSLLSLLKEGVFWWWLGFSLSAATLHLAGALLGAGVGISLLKLRLVDCENWDLFSVWAGKNGRQELQRSDPEIKTKATSDPNLRQKSAEEASLNPFARRRIKCLKAVYRSIQAGRSIEALEHYRSAQHWMTDWHLPRPDLTRLSQALYDAEHWPEALSLFREYIDRWPDDCEAIRLLAADILIVKQQRPIAGLKLLDPPPHVASSRSFQSQSDTLRLKAKQLVDDGVIEADQR